MYIVSDSRNGVYRIVAKFSGAQAQESAKRWAKSDSKVTRLRSPRIFAALGLGQKLPARYA